MGGGGGVAEAAVQLHQRHLYSVLVSGPFTATTTGTTPVGLSGRSGGGEKKGHIPIKITGPSPSPLSLSYPYVSVHTSFVPAARAAAP